MAVITATEAPTFDAGGATITGLASPSRGSADTAVWRVRFHPDHPSPPHAVSREEVFIVLEGAITARFDNREETASAGGVLIVAPGEEFSLVAVGASAEAVCATGSHRSKYDTLSRALFSTPLRLARACTSCVGH